MSIPVNTSNPHKRLEFIKYFGDFKKNVSFTTIDLKEPSADADTVIAYKASQVPEGTLVEDSALFIENCDTAGVEIKWVLDSLEDLIDRKAQFQVRLARQLDGVVQVWTGSVCGTIVERQGQSRFGFDEVFRPSGQDYTYAIAKPKELTPRFRAVMAFASGENPRLLDPIFIWEGPWQNDS